MKNNKIVLSERQKTLWFHCSEVRGLVAMLNAALDRAEKVVQDLERPKSESSEKPE